MFFNVYLFTNFFLGSLFIYLFDSFSFKFDQNFISSFWVILNNAFFFLNRAIKVSYTIFVQK